MARLLARKDDEERYVYVRSLDGYPVPGDVRVLLKQRGGDYGPEAQEWRVHLNHGPEIVAAIRAKGHKVITVEGNGPLPRPPRVRGPLECDNCAQPYPVSRIVRTGETCGSCGAALQLIEPPAEVS